jgi:hypothetical protein
VTPEGNGLSVFRRSAGGRSCQAKGKRLHAYLIRREFHPVCPQSISIKTRPLTVPGRYCRRVGSTGDLRKVLGDARTHEPLTLKKGLRIAQLLVRSSAYE